MAQHDERHLTTEQLSAYIDQHLSTPERAACETHLRSCAQCRQALTGLRQTVALLHALPQPVLPRSFALPAGVARPLSPARPVGQRHIRSSLRVVSSIAAVIGLVILLGGLLVGLPRGASVTMSSARTTSSSNNSNAAPASGSASSPTQAARAIVPHPAQNATATGIARKRQAAPAPTLRGVESGPQPSASPIVNLASPLGLQEVGFTLCALGIVGLLLTRRRRELRGDGTNR